MEYTIPEENYPELEKKLNRLMKKAERYGVPFHFTKKGTCFKKFTNSFGEWAVVQCIVLDMDANEIRQNGWQVIGTIDKVDSGDNCDDGNKFLVLPFGDNIVPEQYWNQEVTYCDHCHSKRHRNHTFVIMNESGEYKQVGSTCIKEYTGIDPNAVAAYAETYTLLENAAYNAFVDYEPTILYYSVAEYLHYAFEAVRIFGYSRSTEENSTKSIAYRWMTENCDRYPKVQREIEEYGVSVDVQGDKRVEEALAWLEAQEDNNAFIHNMKVACGCEYCEAKVLGFIAYLPVLFSKGKEMANSSEFVGEIGSRIEVDVESCRIISSYDTQFGTTKVVQFVDAKGNVYIWKTSAFRADPDDVHHIIGTVKDHSVWNGSRQTVLTRCKVG